jgi:hypothetical protein
LGKGAQKRENGPMGQRKRRGLGQLLVKSRDLEFNDWLARLLVSYSELTYVAMFNLH